MSEYHNTNEGVISYLEFINECLYEALGPANDDIFQEAKDGWKAQGNKIPDRYLDEDQEDED